MKGKMLLLGWLCLVAVLLGTNYAVVVGIDEYRHLGNLKYAEKDAEEIDEMLRSMGYITSLLTGRVDESDILEEIKYMSKYTGPGDQLFFFFSGHGAQGETEGQRGIYTYNSDPAESSYVVSQAELSSALGQFGGTTVVVLDACFQGSEKDRSNMVRDDPALVRKLAQNVDVLVTSSGANQEASDGFYLGNRFIENGVLGYYLLQALNGEADMRPDFQLTAEEFQQYLLEYAEVMARNNGQNLEVYVKDPERKLFKLRMTAEKKRVRIESVPSGAQVWVDGESMGIAPVEIELKEGDHQVRASKSGYEEKEETIRVGSGSGEQLERVVLTRSKGEVTITTSPYGASIYVNGDDKGTSSYTYEGPAGN
ncbi:MAG TPA: PEGA domain-containing protein, partial [Thermotogota bacterium]|nr:PEGA domain-containing protein [Thermotogota bacterium]